MNNNRGQYPEPAGNPFPWLTDVWTRSGAFTVPAPEAIERIAQWVKNGEPVAFTPEAQTLDAITKAVSSTVASLHSDPLPYRVTFSPGVSTAGTDLTGKNIVIGTVALTVDWLTDGQRAAILTGIAVHETGHVNSSQEFAAAVDRKYRRTDPNRATALALSNIGDDNRIETIARRSFPGVGGTIDACMWFVGEMQRRELVKRGVTVPIKVKVNTPHDRMQSISLGARYAYLGDWSEPEAGEALDWITNWARRMDRVTSTRGHLALIGEAIAWIAAAPMLPEEETEEGEEEETEEGGQPGGSMPQPGEGEDEGEGGSEQAEDGEGPTGNLPGDRKAEKGETGEGKGVTDAEAEDAEDEDGDGEEDGEDGTGTGSTGEDAPETSQDGQGDPEDGDDDDDAEDGEDEGEGGQGSQPATTTTPTDHPSNGEDEGEAKVEDAMPDLDSGCATKQAKSREIDNAADAAISQHTRARRSVKRMRRYPNADGVGSVLVRERMWMATPLVDEDDALARTKAAEDAAVANDPFRQHLNRGRFAGNRTTENIGASQAIAAAIAASKKASTAPQRGQRNGTLDASRLARVKSADPKVFVKRNAPSPQSLRVSVMLDTSNSMLVKPGQDFSLSYASVTTNAAGSKMGLAAQLGRDLIGALDLLKNVTGARVYAQTEEGTDQPFVVTVWTKGQHHREIDRYFNIRTGGTPDGYTLAFVADDLLDDRKRGEQAVILVLSDGQPSYTGGVDHVRKVVAAYRKLGIRIVSVSLDPSLSERDQRRMYGDDVVTYNPNARAFARSLARVIGSSI